MKSKKILLGVFASIALVFTSCNNIEEERARSQKTIDSLQSIVDSKNDEMNQFFETLNELEDNLAKVTSKFGSVEELRRGKTEIKNDVKMKINDQINDINSMLAANKQRLNALNKKLADSKVENTTLKEYVEKLQNRISEQENEIQTLVTELEQKNIIIETLNTNVAELTKSNTEKEQIIAKQIADANRVYFIIGTYKELKEAGVVNKTGGFIGLGKKQQVTNNMNTDLFTQIDKTTTTVIDIEREKVKVLSKHPEGSYELVMNDDDVCMSLKINNPTEFWKYTDYLVITTK
jgi:chromosome segregation ATPase